MWTKIPDERGDYIPENYDRHYHGPVRIRTALACSYNVPAVRVLKEIGKDNVLQRMLQAGLKTLDQPASFYGFGLTLGNGEVTLLDMTQAYAAFANEGLWRPARFIDSVQTTEGVAAFVPAPGAAHRIFDARAAYLITSILKDPGARQPAFGHAFRFPFECAVKTGTTKDYRDNWTMGYTTEYTVGVWAGNFDGSPMRGVSGVTGAGQIFTDIMATLHLSHERDLPPAFGIPKGIVGIPVCALSGKLPTSACSKRILEWFIKGREPAERCTLHQRFAYSGPDGATVTKVFAVLPSEYRQWAIDQHFPAPPPGAVRVSEAPVVADHERPALLSPQNGQLYKIDPVLRREFQTLRILAYLPNGTSNAVVHVDGQEVLRYSPDATWWRLQKGVHRFRLEGMLRGKRIQSRPVMITVE